MSATKFDADQSSSVKPSCGSCAQSIELPMSFMSDQSGTFDCALMSSTTNNFVPKGTRNANRSSISGNIVTANIYGGSSRRRRLAESVEYNTSNCYPYFINIAIDNTSAFNVTMSLDDSANFPSCDFWNTNVSYWDTDGCFVFDITNESIICGCTHLTTFDLSKDDILPEANLLTQVDWQNLTVPNL